MTWLHLLVRQVTDTAAPFVYTMYTLSNTLSNGKLTNLRDISQNLLNTHSVLYITGIQLRFLIFLKKFFIKSKTFSGISVIHAFVAKT